MMSYLVRRENFADGTPPPKKPYSAVEFKNSTDTLLQGVYGTGKSSNAFLVDLMQKELDKAVTEGVVTMQEGLEFIKSRKKYYDDYLKEQSKTTDGPIGLPEVEERTELAIGGGAITGKDLGTREGFSKLYGPNIRKKKNQDLLEVTLNRGNETYYDSFSYGDGNRPGPKPKYPNEEAALKAANKFRDSVKNLPKKTGTVMTEKRLELAAERKGKVSDTGKKAEIRNALNDIIKVGGKSFSNEDLRKLVDTSLFDTDDYFRKTVDVVKKEPAFENLTFEKKPRVRLKNDPVSVLQAAASERRKKKLDILGSKEYEKKLYTFKKQVQEGLGLETYKTSGSISGKSKEILPIEMGHQSSIKQLSLLKQKMRPEDLSPQYFEANRKGISKYEGGVQTLENNLNKNFYPAQKKLYIEAKKFIDAGKTVPADLQNKIVSLNEDIQKFVNKTVEKYPLLKDRVNPITIDANDLTVRRGDNVFRQLGIGLVDQNLGDIKTDSIDDLTIKANLAEQTLKEAVDAGLIDEVEGRKKLDKFLKVKNPKIEELSKIPGVTTADKIEQPEKSKIRNMFDSFNQKIKNAGNAYRSIRPGIDAFTTMFPGKADNALAAAIDFPMMYMSGAPISQAAASAGSMFMNNPNIGKMANVALEQAALSEEEQFLKNAMERKQGIESMLQSIPTRFRETIEENKGVKDETETYVP